MILNVNFWIFPFAVEFEKNKYQFKIAKDVIASVVRQLSGVVVIFVSHKSPRKIFGSEPQYNFKKYNSNIFTLLR